MPPAHFYCFKCAISLCCARLCVFIYPCIYLCYMTVSTYELCMYDMHIYLYALLFILFMFALLRLSIVMFFLKYQVG
jgi:hypothetical protein